MSLVQSILLPVGEFKAVDFALPATDDRIYSLSDFFSNEALVIVFTSNHCPYAKAAWPIFVQLAKRYQFKGVGFISINSNDETQNFEDSFDEMKKKALELRLSFPYLRDGYQTAAKAYQAQCTPDTYIFDRKRVLYYHGRVIDKWEGKEDVEHNDVQIALDDLLSGKAPSKQQYPSMGSSIKWKANN